MKQKLLFMMLLLCAMVQGAWGQSNWDVWDGSSQSVPWSEPQTGNRRPNIHIASGSQLAWIAERWNNRDVFDTNRWPYQYDIILEADIDMTAGTWTTLGGHAFEATFYGNGHTIRIKNTTGTSNYQGIFAQLNEGAVVKDLRVEVDFQLGNCRKVGGITGHNYGTISNCWVTGTIKTDHYSIYHADLGGIAGMNDSGGKIEYCCFDGTVSNTAQNTGVGGLVGRNYSTLEHCTFFGEVKTDRSQDNIFVGKQGTAYSNCYQGYNADEYAAANGKEMYRAAIGYPAVKTAKQFTIASDADWTAFASYVSNGCTFKDMNVNLTEDVTAKTMAGITERSSFQGIFNGNGHTITLQMDGDEYDDIRRAVVAPFRYIKGATIKDLTVAGDIVAPNADYTSGLVGYSYDGEDDGEGNTLGNDIRNCVVKAYVRGKRICGFVGNSFTSTITLSGCVFNGQLDSGISEPKSGFIGGGATGGKQNINSCLFIKNYRDKLQDFDLVRGDATLTATGIFKTADVGSQGALVYVYTLPDNLGDPISGGDFGRVTTYSNGLMYDSKYYLIPASPLFKGEGTAGSPYLIESVEDWEDLANSIAFGNTYVDKYFLLTKDIKVTMTVGVDFRNAFCGTFDGDNKTITLNLTGGDYLAPFSHTKNATIKNLKTAGTINTSGENAGGIVGLGHANLDLNNCRSSVTINSSVSGAGRHGGLLGHCFYDGGYITINGCVFDGSFSTTSGTTTCGGFIGFIEGNGLQELDNYMIKNSIMKPQSVAEGMIVGTFLGEYSKWTKYNIQNSFYIETENLPGNQGIRAYKDEPNNEIYRQQTVEGVSCYVPCTVEADQLYQYKVGGITVNKPIVTDANGTELTANTDFTYTPTTVNDQGTRNLTVTGKGNYSGTKIIPIFVTGDTESESLTAGEYTIHDDLEIDWRIQVSGDVVINIPSGVTLTAKKGFELPAGNSLTINGLGALKIEDCDTGKSGIGGATMGTLTINGGQITIKGGEGAAGIGADAGKDASGTVTLGWTSIDDFIQCSSYQVGSITLGKDFMLYGKTEKATAANINTVNKMVPYGKTADEWNPLLINNIDDWKDFASSIAAGKDYNGKFVKLTADININSEPVGVYSETESARRPFSGTFDGDNHTITVSITDTENSGTALFRYIKNATIKKLNVAGTIDGNMHAAALVGFAGGAATETGNIIDKCKVSATVDGGTHIGGLLGHALDSKVHISASVFSGTMLGGATAKGVFIGWGNDGIRDVDDCLYLMPESQSTVGLDLTCQHSGNVTMGASCYKTTDAGSQGIQVYAEAADDEINRNVRAADGNTYYIPCTISGVKDYYKYTGNDITITDPTVKNADGTTLQKGTHFTCTTNPGTVSDEGYYTLTVSGVNSASYTGSKSFVFAVGKYDPVTSETTELSDGTYKVYHKVINNNRININGTVTLDLAEGATFHAPKGIELAGDNMLIIRGAGSLVIDNCENGKSGIGAASMGMLIVRGGQLDIQGATGAGGIGSDAGKPASGQLTISSSNLTDYVKCSSYAVRSNSFTLSGGFVIEGEQTIATTENIGGKKIIPAMVLADQGSTNDTELDSYNGLKLAVALKDRTFYLDNKWNTIYLPFDYNLSNFKGAEARTLTSASITGVTLNLTFGEPVDVLEAGVPYIIKFDAETYQSNGNQHLVNPVFEKVTIKKESRDFDNGASGDARVRFLGTYKNMEFSSVDNSILQLGGSNMLYNPSAGASIGACRAYFKLGDGSVEQAPRVNAFSVSFGGGGETTGISLIPSPSTMGEGSNYWYTLDGRQLDGQPKAKGVYINRGKKVVIK